MHLVAAHARAGVDGEERLPREGVAGDPDHRARLAVAQHEHRRLAVGPRLAERLTHLLLGRLDDAEQLELGGRDQLRAQRDVVLPRGVVHEAHRPGRELRSLVHAAEHAAPRRTPSLGFRRIVPPDHSSISASDGQRLRRGSAEQVALARRPAVLAQDRGLLGRLHALGDALEVQAARQTGQAPAQRVRRALALGQIGDEGPVELEARHREARAAARSRSSRPEVVDVKPHAPVTQALEVVARRVEQREHSGLGHLQHEPFGSDPVPAQRVEHLLRPVQPGELHRGDVDADRPRRVRSRGQPIADLVENLGPDVHDEAGLLGDSRKAAGASRPRSGCCQRTSASWPTTRRDRRSITGW